jgi:hypothetical protein
MTTGSVSRTLAATRNSAGRRKPHTPPAASIVISNIVESELTTTGIRISWHVSPASTGQIEYGITSGYGSVTTLETGLLTDHSQLLPSLSPSTTYHYRILCTNIDGTGDSGDRTFRTDDVSVPSSNSMYIANIYGSAMNIDTRNNYSVATGANANVDLLSWRFIASRSSAIQTVRWQQRTGTGYSNGNGGTYRLTLRADDGTANHLPGSILATSADYSPGNPGTYEKLEAMTFPSPYTVTAGTTYHLVLENVHASQATNYISVNCSMIFGTTLTPRQPAFTQDFAVLTYRGSWQLRGQDTANIEIKYADLSYDGNGFSAVYQAGYGLISGTSLMVRENFTVSGGNKTVVSIYVRVGRQSGTSLLSIRLEDGAGSLLSEGLASDSGSTVPITVPNTDSSNGAWVHRLLPAQVTLTDNTNYHIRLSCAAGTQYSMVPIQHGILLPPGNWGTDWRYLLSRHFPDGAMQKTTNGSSWATPYGGLPLNMQMYMVLA